MRLQQLKMARAALGVGIREFSSATGVAVSSIQRFEKGDTVTTSTAERLQTALEDRGVVFEERDGMLWVGIPRDRPAKEAEASE